MTTDILSEIEIMAYVDGELDLDDRLRVEEYLWRNPAIASRVIGELRTRTALKLLSTRSTPMQGRLAVLAHRLSRRRQPPSAHLFWGAAGASVIALSVAAALLVDRAPRPPAYVVDAVASHRTAMLRAAMNSQLESPHFDAREILSKTKIAMPTLPADWKVTDVQLFPAGGGSALMVAVKTPAGESLSIFAVRAPTAASERPDAVRAGVESVAFWRHGDVFYALTGDDDVKKIDASAEALTRLWNS